MTSTAVPVTAAAEMPPPSLRRRVRATLGAEPVPWGTVTVLAVLLAAADAFGLSAVQGAVGAIERSQGPFLFWLEVTALTLPVFFLAVLGALAIARRRLRRPRHSLRGVLTIGLLVVAFATLLGTAELGISAVADYRLQSELLAVQHANHATGDGSSGGHIDPAAASAESLKTDVLGARYGAGIDLAANAALVGWVALMRGGRLDWAPRRRRTRS